MKWKQNQQGMALITVLLIITIFTILGMSAMSFTMQSNQLRTYSDDEVEGKMLAEMGLLYFQEYLEKSLKIKDVKAYSANPTNVNTIIEEIAYKKPDSGERFKVIKLPNDQGAFAFMYEDLLTVPFKDENDLEKYTQPFSKKIKLSVIGIPKNAIGDSGSRVIRKRLDANLYINTIPSPFHYAISTPNQLHLFGGSNIIGNIEAGNKILVSNYYRFSEYSQSDGKDKWYFGSDPKNQPYVEGKVFLRTDAAQLYHSDTFTQDPTNTFQQPTPSEKKQTLNRQDLQQILTPKDQMNNPEISAPVGSPDEPGTEPPFFEKTSSTISSIPFGPFGGKQTLKAYIKSQFFNTRSLKNITIGNDNKPLALEEDNHWLYVDGSTEKQYLVPGLDSNSFNSNSFDSNIAIIYSKQGNEYLDDYSFKGYELTARLSGNWLQDNNFSQLYIGLDPDSWNDNENTTVEMGSTHSFDDPPDLENIDGPFSFIGPIYIKGNLDIVGNIKVQGTIFVDGDVVIRDIKNLERNYNLVIMATGKITLSNRNSNDPLRAFLYSEANSLEIYSIDSIHRIDGGIATGSGSQNASIELNTLRRTTEPYNSHLTIKFDRGIFERPTPGLPSDHYFYIDTYDMVYTNFQGNIE